MLRSLIRTAAGPPAWDELHHRILREIRSRRLFPEGSRVLMAVSGGQDSLALVGLIRDLERAIPEITAVGVAHCDHRWKLDAGLPDFVSRTVQEHWQLDVTVRKAECPDKCGTETSARTWRYQELADMAKQGSYNVVATGHTRSDVAETVLLNLFRGSGMPGLCSLGWSRPLEGDGCSDVSLVRPLLGVSRAETAAYCAAKGIEYWTDGYNQDLGIGRNRVRHELLPLVTEHFNPAIEMRLANAAEILREESHLLDSYGRTALRKLSLPSKCGVALDADGLVQLSSVGLQRRVVRLALADAGAGSCSFEVVTRVLQLASPPLSGTPRRNHGRICLPGGLAASLARHAETQRTALRISRDKRHVKLSEQ